jgi:hypothetical protein
MADRNNREWEAVNHGEGGGLNLVHPLGGNDTETGSEIWEGDRRLCLSQPHDHATTGIAKLGLARAK